MTFGDVIVSLAAATAVLAAACVLACIWRLGELRAEVRFDKARRRLVFISATTLVAALAWQNAYSWYAWERGVWLVASSDPVAVIPPRVMAIAALVSFGGATLWRSCRHRGWLSLVGIAAFGAVVARAI